MVRSARRRGLVPIAIIGVLIGLLAPAVQKVRQAAARAQCQKIRRILAFRRDREDIAQLPGITMYDLSNRPPCDFDENGSVDVTDLNALAHSLNAFTVGGDPRDPNRNFKIDAADLRMCIERCAAPGCGLPQ